MADSFLTAPTTPSQYAELVIQCVGLLLLMVLFGRLTASGRWGELVADRPVPAHSIRPVDLLAAFIAFFYLTPVTLWLLGAAGGATSAPASEPSSATLPTLPQLEVMICVRVLGVALLILIGAHCFVGGLRGWGLSAQRIFRDIGLAAVVYLAFWPICTGIMLVTRGLIEYFRPGYQFVDHTAIQLLRTRDAGDITLWITALDAMFVAPIIEELFFRGLLMPAVARWWQSTASAIAFSAVAFGAIHYTNIETVPALTLFGAVLGLVYVRTGRLTAAIALHMIFNMKTLLWLAIDMKTGAAAH